MLKALKYYRYWEIVMVTIGIVLFTKQVKDELDSEK